MDLNILRGEFNSLEKQILILNKMQFLFTNQDKDSLRGEINSDQIIYSQQSIIQDLECFCRKLLNVLGFDIAEKEAYKNQLITKPKNETYNTYQKPNLSLSRNKTMRIIKKNNFNKEIDNKTFIIEKSMSKSSIINKLNESNNKNYDTEVFKLDFKKQKNSSFRNNGVNNQKICKITRSHTLYKIKTTKSIQRILDNSYKIVDCFHENKI